ncbi:peroxiredoxin family protein [Gelidibacter salicanalis]|uniref:TlpA family protein disulfide reductase n=1 Tax=Gelidibacter salicanalis TaxID=291193 RepID=A0A934KRS8_9FLAO|nr:TlpA disulfide reductase family protein [Gelidibacter salicanalis]MBJ7882634.1 TlpA family protein disulfide reductase [Gelidibacter salicanalis]
MKYLILIFFALTMVSCNEHHSKKMQEGHWLGQLQVSADEKLPFNFEVTSANSLKITNAQDVILVDEVTYKNDSVFIKMPVFDGYFAVNLTNEGMSGRFINPTMNTDIPFEAVNHVKTRFKTDQPPGTDVTGNWEVLFSPKADEESYIAKGVFKQTGEKVTGTFRTKTGDYRYLQGVVDGDQLKLSTFDGAHAYLFLATVKDNSLSGVFYSGNTWEASFSADRNDDFELPDANTLTTFNKDYERLEFSFPDENGRLVSLEDAQFKNKVVVVQLMGTWCPNCLDESIFFSDYAKNNSDKAVQFVALAFENAKTDSLAFASIKRLKDRLGIQYPVLLAQHGTSDKLEAQKKMPMLNEVVSYPTTVFIDKRGQVRKIHTGFNGPATGEKYVAFKNEFSTFIDALLAE